MSAVPMLALNPATLEEDGLASGRGSGSLGVSDKGFPAIGCRVLNDFLSLVQMQHRGVLRLLRDHFCRPHGMDKCSELFNKARVSNYIHL